ncbi:OpgC domain-containing protein [Ferrovibrio terrae]|uniref:OpgC domain-containing protein n=1 Tax=Ferrovibrio terrae TaxID=2594003 RepID=A0A516H242_9PROT|nr:OpgC domain-containing protein [Ferrovibrio terrae]QDO97848.1 OpgC domain-containing protein [Ferrovibrio terrae]
MTASDQISAASKPAAKARDLRLDFFRGLALLFIFLNHIPNNAVSWLSNRNYGFSDATETFVFISGYSVLLAYGAAMRSQGFVIGTARIWRRVWQIYTAHVFLFIIFIAQIAWLAARYNLDLAEEMNIGSLFEEPHILMLQALLLKFRPVNMDVLPMYIALMGAFPPVMWLMQRRPHMVLAASFALWFVVQFTHWNLPAYPDGRWYFNPLAWQFLFVLGAWCAMHRQHAPWRRLPAKAVTAAAVLYVIFSAVIVLSWLRPEWASRVPDVIERLLYPIDKTEMDTWRLLHFLALAWLVVLLVSPDAKFLRWPLSGLLILCGQHSLHVFCAGIFLSFAGHFVLSEVAPGLVAQLAVSMAGIVLLVGLAALMTWYKAVENGRRTGEVKA